MDKYTKEECLEEIENCGTLDNIDLSELDLRAVDFKGISLKRAKLTSARLNGANLSGCDDPLVSIFIFWELWISGRIAKA